VTLKPTPLRYGCVAELWTRTRTASERIRVIVWSSDRRVCWSSWSRPRG